MIEEQDDEEEIPIEVSATTVYILHRALYIQVLGVVYYKVINDNLFCLNLYFNAINKEKIIKIRKKQYGMFGALFVLYRY